MLLIFGTVLACSAALFWYQSGGKNKSSKPPGPTGLPVIGNLLDVPRSREVLTYNAMADKYGDIVYLSVAGKNIFIVSSGKILNELFYQRSSNYSDRPYSTMMNKLMGLEWIFAFTSYGSVWRDTRKMFHSQFQETVVPDLRPMQLKAAHDVLRRIIASPDDSLRHLHLHVAGFLLGIAYAMELTPEAAGLVQKADEVIEAWTKVAVPGAYLVDALPFLRYIPEWLIPGGGFQKDARVAKNKAVTARNIPFEMVQKEMAEGIAPPSFVSNLLNDAGPDANIELIRATAGTIYFAGTEAISITLTTFIMAMLVYPDIQRKGQAEIDQVVGKDRLPDFGDQDSLPFCNAIVKEVLRWNPPAPMAIPHVTVNDDQYEGYHIPARSLVIANLWRILHDPEVYPSPTEFRPDRFMPSENEGKVPTIVLETFETVFGPGRRICPGRFVATAQLFITISSLLSAFNIGPGLDSDGEAIPVIPDFSYSLASHPNHFKFTITPRGKYVQDLLDLDN
ncbi:cytochrome P450 monooxygenase [Gymnopus androsaceus JB14]|uniref:Cytochrome P450 monooxygenase n=1 Tax=Gymnopus androsaceus JB14 TaxID=1447944 RepID=A0A6A4GZR1_9AGAR|nr:cytochrome P450 monooxygenase [Gymnopus androsaceus JB14]